mgnify:CR=1 FL=1
MSQYLMKSIGSMKVKTSIDPEQLQMGIKVEMEHTNDPAIAEKIARDHLAEIKDYYSRLKKMESSVLKKSILFFGRLIKSQLGLFDKHQTGETKGKLILKPSKTDHQPESKDSDEARYMQRADLKKSLEGYGSKKMKYPNIWIRLLKSQLGLFSESEALALVTKEEHSTGETKGKLALLPSKIKPNIRRWQDTTPEETKEEKPILPIKKDGTLSKEKVVKELPKSETRPEKMQVIKKENQYLVQTYSDKQEKWITQAEHVGEQEAIKDAEQWYQEDDINTELSDVLKNNNIGKIGSDKYEESDLFNQPMPEPKTSGSPKEEVQEIVTGRKSRQQANEAAIEILNTKEDDQMTDEDKKLLSLYSGDGGTDEVSLNEFYTHPLVVDFMWKFLAKLGFKGGQVLEPSCATGIFINKKPEDTLITGVEISPISSRIAGILNPNDDIIKSSYENYRNDYFDDKYDGIVGNIPFGIRGASRGEHRPDISTYEEYFMDELPNALKEGGIMGMIVPTGVMNNLTFSELRKKICEQAQFVTAFRMPNKAFKHTGTSVTTDIIFLKKHPDSVVDAVLYEKEAVRKGEPANPNFDKLNHKSFIDGTYFQNEGKNNIWGEEAIGQWGSMIVKGELQQEYFDRALEAEYPIMNYEGIAENKPQERELHVGDTIFVRGHTYRLNENHRWERFDKDEHERQRRLNVDFEHWGVGNRDEFHRTLKDPAMLMKLTADDRLTAKEYLEVVSSSDFDNLEQAQIRIGNAIEAATKASTPEEASKYYSAAILGSYIRELQEHVANGNYPDHRYFQQIVLLLDEYKKQFGNPSTDKKLQRQALFSKDLARIIGAFTPEGDYSDFMKRPEDFLPEEAKGEQTYKADDPESILKYFERQGIQGDVNTFARYYEMAKGKTDDELEAVLLSFDNIGYDNDKFVPLERVMTGSVYDKLDRWNAAIAKLESSDDAHKELKIDKLKKQSTQLELKANKRIIEDMPIYFKARWMPLQHLNDFLKSKDWKQLLYDEDRGVYEVDTSTIGEELPDRYNMYGDFIRYINNLGLEHGVQNKDRLASLLDMEREYKSFLAVHPQREWIENLYNRKFNNYIEETFDNTPLKIDKLSKNFSLNAYHNSAIRRLIEKGRGLLAFSTGLGKTMSSIGLALYNKQIGNWKKPMVVVPKSVLSQWVSEIKRFTGENQIKLLVIGEREALDRNGVPRIDKDGRPLMRDETAEEAQAKLQHAAQNDYDIILISDSKLDTLTLSPTRLSNYMDDIVDRHVFKSNADLTDRQREEATAKLLGRITSRTKGDDDRLQNIKEGKKGGTFKSRAINFDELGIDGMIVDECLPYHSKILTEIGWRKIGEIVDRRENIKVYSFNDRHNEIELKSITNWMSKPLNHKIVKLNLSNGKHIVSTHNHKILTRENGYVPAIESKEETIFVLQEDDNKDMQTMQYGIPIQVSRSNKQFKAGILFSIMRSILSSIITAYQRTKTPAIPCFSGCYKRSEITSNIYKNEKKQPDVKPHNQRENAPIINGKDIPCERRERSTNDSTNVTFTDHESSYGISDTNSNGKRIVPMFTKLLQGRFSNSRKENSNRNRWQNAQAKKMEIFRSPKDKSLKCVRVDSIEILERGSYANYGFRSSKDSTVYDITVADNHNFICEGVIVSNCHNYKNLFGVINNRTRGVMGDQQTSQSMRMYLFSKYINELKGNKNMYLMSATPTPNNPLEVFNMFQYFAPDEMDKRQMYNIEQFLDMFGEITSIKTQKANGKIVDENVLSGFSNLPELRQSVFEYTDMRNAKDVGLKVPEEKARHIMSAMTPLQERVYKGLRNRADVWLKMNAAERKESGDNILKIIGDMVKASVSLRLLKDTTELGDIELSNEEITEDGYSPKVQQCVEHSVDFYKQGKKKIIFARYKALQHELKDALVKSGIPENDIYVFNADTTATSSARMKVSDDYNAGKYKIVIGNEAMSEGMNFQVGTGAVDNLMLAWTPDELTQRKGRGLRQGNKEKEVEVNYYFTSGTIDSLFHEILSRKTGWQYDLYKSKADKADNPNANGRQFTPQEIEVMLSDNPEEARRRLEDLKKSGLEKEKDELKSRALANFNQLQNFNLQYNRMNKEERTSDKGKEIQSRITNAKSLLNKNEYFEHKGLLENDKPVYIDSDKRVLMPVGQMFTKSDGNYNEHGLYKLEDVDPISREVKIRKIIHKERSWQLGRESGDITNVDYKTLRENFADGMKAVDVPPAEMDEAIASNMKNIKTATMLSPEYISNNRKAIISKINKDEGIPYIDRKTGNMELGKVTNFVIPEDEAEYAKEEKNEPDSDKFWTKQIKEYKKDMKPIEDAYLPVDPIRWRNDILKVALEEKAKSVEEHKRYGSHTYGKRGRHTNTRQAGKWESFTRNLYGWDWDKHLPTDFKNTTPIIDED